MSFFPDEKWMNWVDRLSEDHYLVVDNFLSEELYQQIRNFFLGKLEDDAFSRAGVGALGDYQIKTSVRGDFIYWLDREKDKDAFLFFEMVREMIEQLNKHCFLSLSGSEFHLAYYPEGSFYRKHLDQFRGRNNRLISVIIYLNEGWKSGDGGELKIFKPGNDILIEPMAKRLVIFKSDKIEHEVMVTRTGRYSLTGWLLYHPSSLGYLMG